METDQSICEEFCSGSLKLIDAIAALERIGFEPLEAEQMVNEWADFMEHENSQFGAGA